MLAIIHLWSHLFLDLCLGAFGFFKSQFQFHYLLLVCTLLLFFPGSVLEDGTFLSICPVGLGCVFYWQTPTYSSLCDPLYFMVSVITFPFSFFPFLVKGSSIFFIFSKNQVFVLLIFAIIFFIPVSFISDLIFMISFFYILHLFSEVRLSCSELPSLNCCCCIP